MSSIEGKDNFILQEDLQTIAESSFLDTFADRSTLLITGATGLIGSLIVKSLLCHNRLRQKNLKVIALLRDSEKALQVFGTLIHDENLQICVHDITEEWSVEGTVDYIIHAASATSSKYFVEKPVETILTALGGTQRVLDFARLKQVKKVVYLSSLEVYGTPDENADFVTETDYGYIDPLQVRSSYSEGKRIAECLCVSYAKEYAVPVTIARLSQTFGAGVSYHDSRVFAEFARCVIEKKPIVLHTPGRTVRTYCYTSDAVNAILCLLQSGQPAEAYNVTNMETAVSIREMAQLVSTLSHDPAVTVEMDLPQDIETFGYNPEMVIRLDNTKLKNLGWHPTVGLSEMYERLIQSMRQDKQ